VVDVLRIFPLPLVFFSRKKLKEFLFPPPAAIGVMFAQFLCFTLLVRDFFGNYLQSLSPQGDIFTPASKAS